ncbi:2Fe-2S iron-sulfur cluster binding domain-containing protein [Xylophilus rhododendri]|uniref:2Fe-2S iron-sulfur cluster binding domain-containing protein n=1 Tax=Xylophilus rhododendri TaxID=2697032 RepID=A0A857J0S3_9BURK|nr:pyridoxamine 5'-phosphate oxidase family protein [Xylophilus rhododendri]QHI97197.1 2Fe-2S iron-sulfur cluster binding domain-containing protein [Xylophilus rhododendri]
MDSFGRQYVRTFMPEQHREFFPLLPFVLLGAVDPGGDVWATMRAGVPGFLSAPDEHHLSVDTVREPADPADAGLEDGDAVGLLGIDLMTRRRNRLNGIIRRTVGEDRFSIEVGQSFGACPRYITNRSCVPTRPPGRTSPQAPRLADGMDAEARRLIASADSLFVASYIEAKDSRDGRRQVDVSHRGGKPGFVRLDADGGLTVPEFNGNLFFNTLGNFVLNPKAGLLFVDYETGDMLQMTGVAEVILDSPEIAAFQGAERLWRFMPRKVVHRPAGLPLRWDRRPDGASPSVFLTGSWDEASARLQAQALAGRWRPFRIARATEESSTVRSLVLEAADGVAMVPHLAGQHLPLRLVDADASAASGPAPIRSYTLSSAPGDKLYRISVKRDGVVSQGLHRLQEGELVEVQGPAGAFTIDASQRRPAVLLAAGIGITPILSMLRHLVLEGVRTRHRRPAWIFHSARTKAERAFDREIAQLAGASEGAVRRVRVLGSGQGAKAVADYDAIGRIDLDLLQAHLPLADYDFYLCGPAGFMQSLYDGLRSLNIADERIHAESFGPAGLKRSGLAASSGRADAAPSPVAAEVVFSVSGRQATWKPGDGSILEIAEKAGLAPAYGCRSGSCGTCRTRIGGGQVAYITTPTAPVGADEALVCCAVPATALVSVIC